ncbi:AMP-binding enzyme domain-containing protein [Sarocladium implicatum]|nr:AMP-binding enzyme domain-containing protein [Sarocladium implicatum]
MTFHPPSYVPDVPLPADDVSIPDFLFGPKSEEYGGVQKSKALNPFTDALTGRTFTRDEYHDRYQSLARALAAELGVEVNGEAELEKVIGIYSYNSIDTMAAAFATHRIGGVACQIGHQFNVPELVRQLNRVECKALFTCAPLAHIAIEAAAVHGLPRERIYIMDTSDKILDGKVVPSDLKTVDQLIAESANYPELEPLRMEKGEGATRVAYLCSSSGTSGMPKSVMISHSNVIANIQAMSAFESGHKGPNPDVGLGVLPLSHIYGLCCVGHQGLYRGDNVVLLPSFDLIDVLQTIQNYKIYRTWFVPPMMIAMVKANHICKKYDLSSIRHVVTGALPIPEKMMSEFGSLIPESTIVRVYGMTEISGIASFGHPYDLMPGSVGNLMPGMTARLVSLEGEEIVDKGLPGNLLIHVRGASPLGYYKNPEATQEMTSGDGWIRTGDLAEFRTNEKGEDHLIIVDRVKEMIKVRGLQVAPTELEGWLVRQPTVRECCVVPMHSETAGEIPIAFVIRTEDTMDLDEQVVKDAIHEGIEKNFAEYKKLAGGIVFVDSFPKSQGGKILRGQMKQKAREVYEATKAKQQPVIQSFEFSDSEDDSDEESDED